jgi:hypothetical protein
MSSSRTVSREWMWLGGLQMLAFSHPPLGQIRHLKGVLEHDKCAVQELVVGEIVRREGPGSYSLLDHRSSLGLELKVTALVRGMQGWGE